MTGPAEPAARLIEDLTASGDLAAEWRPVFEAVPRHRFVPDTVWTEETGRLVPVRRADEPERWLELCYRNDFVITQVDDGRPAGPGPVGQEITSSASRPDVVALMLAALDAEPGMSVLEIGTGTGWNAALLAERLGAGRVTTVEIDSAVAEHARTALRRAGHDVTVVVGDGAQGYPPAAPYDRVIATAAVRRIPAAWARQTRPGGRVLVPWATDFHNGALVAFQVSAGHTMRGRIVGNVAFMMLREQRGRRASLARDVYDVERAARSVTHLHPYDLLGEYNASLAVGLRVPRCKPVVEQHGEGAYTLWLIDPWSRSWACLSNRPGTDAFPVRQLGPRRLWDEVADAHHWWAGLGKPVAGRWGLTVTPAEQYVWLDTEDNRIAGPE